MRFETILVDEADGTGKITLNRPGALNAINNKMLDELGIALTNLDADPEIRVLVVTGAGRAFSAGRDKGEIGQPTHRSASDLWVRIEDLGKPIIAAVNGLCYTGALSMLLCFDLVIAADVAIFADTHAKFGMYHGGGTTQRLRSVVGPLKAKEILFSCEPMDAAEAMRIGLVNRVVPSEQLDQEVAALARAIARNDPDAIRVAKTLINQGTKWGSAVGFELEEREYRRQRKAVADGTAKIEISADEGRGRDA
jgi:enoyl-CoA hydratase